MEVIIINEISNIYTTGQMAKKLNVLTCTLVSWDQSKKLVAHRTPTNQWFYTQEQVNAVLCIEPANPKPRQNVAYARVSSQNQKDGLKNQILLIQNFVNAKGIILDQMLQDITSIIHVFSCRLSGLRKYQNKIKNDETIKKRNEMKHK